MACGQLKPSDKKNQSNIFGVGIPGCATGQVKNATSFNQQKAALEAVQICPGTDLTSVSVTSANPVCVYSVIAATNSVNYPGQCTQPNATTGNKSELRFSGGAFNSVVIVMASDQNSYESSMSYRGGAVVVPYAMATIR